MDGCRFAYASLNYRGSVTLACVPRRFSWNPGATGRSEDVAAAIAWLHAQGLADPASTFITGASYGGTLAAASVGCLPEMLAGGFATWRSPTGR
ncbi:alpha/beta hydrolase family protein [Vibrio alginolyticus]